MRVAEDQRQQAAVHHLQAQQAKRVMSPPQNPSPAKLVRAPPYLLHTASDTKTGSCTQPAA